MAAELFTTPAPALSPNAAPYGGAKWYFYASGTTTPQAVYADADLANSLGSVVTADSAGRFPAIYFDAALAYRAVLKNVTGSDTLYDFDPVLTGSGIISDLQSNNGLALIGTQQGIDANDLLFNRSALSLVRGAKEFAQTWQQVLDRSADLTEMRGFAAYAGTTGGAGKPVFKVWNDSDDVNTVGCFRWAVAQAKAAGGGQILGVEEGLHTVMLRTRILIDFNDVTIAFPGRNWRFGSLNDVEMIRIAGINVIMRDAALFRYAHYTPVDNQILEYASGLGNLVAGQTVFAVSFPFFESSGLTVRKNRLALLTEGVDYTVSGGGGPSGSTGTITLTSAVSISDNIRIFGKIYQADGISIRPESCDKVWLDRCTLTDHTDGAIDLSSSLLLLDLPATGMTVGNRYEITTLGTTDWNVAAGTSAVTYAVGSTFKCAVVGTGTGVVRSAPCRVTVSRSIIRNQLEAMAVGSSATSAQTPPPAWASTGLTEPRVVSLSLDRNIWEACSQRSPRVGPLAYVHSVNNVHVMSAFHRDDGTTSAQYAAWATTGGQLLSEGDYLMQGGPDVPENGMYATETAWDASTRIGPGGLRLNGTVAETGISLIPANTANVPAPPYTLVVDDVPATDRLDYVVSRMGEAGAEVSPLSEMTYTFVLKAEGDAQGLYVDGFNVVSVPGGYRVRTRPEMPATGANPVTSFTAGSLSFPRGNTITIASDTLTLREGFAFFAVGTEAAAATDNLSTINPATGTNLPDGYVLGLRPGSNSQVFTLVSGGNISLPNGPVVMNSTAKTLWLHWDLGASLWRIISSNGRSEGEYTPTLTNVANVASSAVGRCFWARENGSDYVTVWYNLTVTPTAGATLTDLGVTLPVASNLAATGDLIGSGGAAIATAVTGVTNFQDTANDRATMRFISGSTAAHSIIGSFRYKVL